MLGMMTRLLAALLLVLTAAPASAQQFPDPAQAPPSAGPALPPAAPGQPQMQAGITPQPWNPAADYVTVGQDEPGYRNWYMASPRHASQVAAFNAYLQTWEVGGIVPTWQLLRTASMWAKCGAAPFEVPPTAEWSNLVQTLRYVRDYVVPAIGPVEPVSAYRNPTLNACAGGAPDSAHKHFQAVDLVPLRATTREALMRTLCAAHLRRGSPYQVGLGFYAFLRFHIDSMRFRKWGMADAGDASPCSVAIAPPVVAAPVLAPAPLPVEPAPAQPLPDPLQPAQAVQPDSPTPTP